MKTFIITKIAKQYRKKVEIARDLKIKHVSYMYEYSYIKLLKSYYKALSL